MFIPNVKYEGIRDQHKLQAMLPLVENAAATLVNWWPHGDDFGAPEIRIVESQNVQTITSMRKTGKGEPLAAFINFGIDALEFGAGKHFIDSKWSRQESATIMLAHETFHASENGRMSKCSIEPSLIKSGFATGIDPEMSDLWKQASRVLATEYESRIFMLPLIRKGSDIVSELRADIRALNALKLLGYAWPKIAKDVLSLRAIDEAADPDHAYCISKELSQIIAMNPMPSERESLPILWRMSFEAMEPIAHSTEVRQAIQSARNALDLISPKPSPMGKSRWFRKP